MQRKIPLILLVSVIAVGLAATNGAEPGSEIGKAAADGKQPSRETRVLPRVIDLSRHYNQEPDPGSPCTRFAGRQEVDQLPFRINGEVALYDESASIVHDIVYRDALGIPVACRFDELHLVHFTRWPDVPGETVAQVRFNYADGSHRELPIRYGAHLLDGWRHPTEESEELGDPNSKICWHETPTGGKRTELRLFKSMLLNPAPEKEVTTIDLISSHRRAIYCLCGATVTSGSLNRVLSPSQAASEPPRRLDGQLVIRAIDKASGKPVPGAVVETVWKVRGTGYVGPTALTAGNGEAVIRYPAGETGGGTVWVTLPGYASASMDWPSSLPKRHTFTMEALSTSVYRDYDREFRNYLAKAVEQAGKETIKVERLSDKFTVPQRLFIQGTFYDVGVTIGLIGKQAGFRLPILGEARRSLNPKVRELYQSIYPQYLEFVRGVAAAYKRPPEDMDLGVFEYNFTTMLWCRLLKNGKFYAATDFGRFGDAVQNQHCSAASFYMNGHHIVGRNFDNPSDRPHFFTTMDMAGTYKVIGHTIYGITSWATDGMNEKGLSVCVTSNNDGKYACSEPYPGEPAILLAHMSQVIMQTRATVDEALAVLRKVRIWFPDESNHWLLADATGKAVIVEWTPGDHQLAVFDKPGPYELLTNTAFQEGEDVVFKNCWRYRRARPRLEAGVKDATEMFEIMKSIRPTVGGSRSLWTSVMDLNARTFEVHYFKEYDREYRFHF